jgi:hypothetical protein
MTTQIFRKIVLVIIAIDLAWFIIDIVLSHSLPPELVAYKVAADAARVSKGLWHNFQSLFEFILVICWFVNLIGLYKLRPKSRLRFLIIQIALFSLYVFAGPAVVHPLVEFLNDLSEFGHGLLLALIYWSPIAIHFGKSTGPSVVSRK